VGGVKITNTNGKYYVYRLYRCNGRWKINAPVKLCQNKSWGADKLEAFVWTQIERVLDNPELIITEIEKQRQGANQLGILETELQQVERQLKALDRDQKELLDNAMRGFPENLIIAENKKINAKRTTLEAQNTELETQIKTSQDAAINVPNVERFVELMRQKLTTLDFETKRMALDMLGIKVWLDCENVEITGVLPITDGVTLPMQS